MAHRNSWFTYFSDGDSPSFLVALPGRLIHPIPSILWFILILRSQISQKILYIHHGFWGVLKINRAYNMLQLRFLMASEIRGIHQLKTLGFYIPRFTGFQPSQIGAGFLRTIHSIQDESWNLTNDAALLFFAVSFQNFTSILCLKMVYLQFQAGLSPFSHLTWWFWGIPHFQTNPNGWRNHEKSPYFLICSTQSPMVHYVSWSTSFAEALTSYSHANSTVSSWYP